MLGMRPVSNVTGPPDHLQSPGEERAALAGSADRGVLALADVLSLLNREVSPDEWARTVLPLIVDALDVDTGALLRVSGDTEAEVLAAFGRTRKRGYPYGSVDLRDAILSPLAQQSRIITLDAAQRNGLQPALRELCHSRFQMAFLASAFMGHALGGLVVLSRRERRALTPDETTYLAAVADAIGLALGVATLSQESHMSEVVLETAGAVARAISGSLDLSYTFRQVAHSAARVMGDCNCLLLATDDETSDLVAVACSDPADDALLGLQVRFEDVPSNREALAQRRSIVVEDVAWGAGTSRACHDRLHIRSALFVPIHSEDGLIGSLLLYSTARRDRYSKNDVARAEIVAEQAASAICNARLYRNLEHSESRAKDLLERITRLRERQRLTFANVVHDDIVQTVVAALYQVEGFRAGAGAETAAELEGVAEMLKQAITDARRVIWDLRPPVLDGLGLDGALNALADRVAAEGDMLATTELTDLPPLPPGVTTALYMIAREALQNARRHAYARHVALSLSRVDNGADVAVRLRVVDDGVGFDRHVVDSGEHFGLTMMDEQAALAGGSLTLDTHPGGGTSIEVVVPLSAEG